MARKPTGGGKSRPPKGRRAALAGNLLHRVSAASAGRRSPRSSTPWPRPIRGCSSTTSRPTTTGCSRRCWSQSPEDHAAVEISYETGEAVIEQNLEWAKQLQKQLSPKQLQQLVAADARLDVAHFERVAGRARRRANATPPKRAIAGDDDVGDDDFDDDFDAGDDDFDEEAALEIFDPTCLLTVVETLSKLTRGLAFDPAAGEVV